MPSIFWTTRGRYAMRVQVSHLLGLDELEEVLCRALSKNHDTSESVPDRLSKAYLTEAIRDELAFGGYEAYGHLWSDNWGGDDEDMALMREKVRALLIRAWPSLGKETRG